MSMSRRIFMASGFGATMLAPHAGFAFVPERCLLKVADPNLLHAPLPSGAIIAASGNALLAALLPHLDGWRRIEAVLGEADAKMLGELVRFEPGLRWSAVSLLADSRTFAGCLRRPAYGVFAICKRVQ